MSRRRSDRWYSRLLSLFPAEFRADFAESMRADFADEAREARRRGGRAVAALWLRTVGGALRVGPREHVLRVIQDARYGWRLALRRPIPTLASALILGLGIAALTTTFAIVDAFLLRPMPFADPDRLVHVWTTERVAEDVMTRSSWPDVQRWASASSVQGIAAFNYTEEDLLSGPVAERIHAARVSANLFRVLGGAPASGRAFHDGEDRIGAAPVAVVSERFANERLGAAAGAIGQSIRIGAATFEIVGVMPRDFVFPLPVTDVWLPYAFAPETFTRDRLSLQVVARLRPGVSPGAAAAELDTMTRAQSQAHGDRVPRGAAIEPLRDALNFADDIFRTGGPILIGASLLILLVACANVSSVLIGQAIGRARESGLRTALGASRLRLIREFVFEQSPLIAASALAGLGLAQLALRAVSTVIPPDLYRVGDLAVDVRALLVAVAAAVVAVTASALLPGLRLGRSAVTNVLRESGATQTASARALWLQHGLIGLQICVSVALVAATIVALRSLDGLASRDPGFDRRGALTMKFILGSDRYPGPDALATFHASLNERLRQVPGVVAAATVNHLPLNHEAVRLTYAPAGAQPAPITSRPSTTEIVVSPAYFAAMGILLEGGRDFDGRDTAAGAPAGIVNRALADRAWPGERAVGRRLRLGESGAEIEVVGVVANARHRELAGAEEPIVYRPIAQIPRRVARLVVRTGGDPLALTAAVQQAVREIDPALPLTEIRTLDAVVREFMLPQRAMSVAMGALGVVALAVAAVGLYGLLTVLVANRQREIGIRVALGAGARTVVQAIARRVIIATAAGLIAGLGASLLFARAMASLLPGAVGATPVALLVTPIVLAVVVAAAALVPVRRAARVDPVSILRG